MIFVLFYVIYKPEQLIISNEKEVNVSIGIAGMNNTSEPQPKNTGKDSMNKESSTQDLLKFAGTWQGDDLEECLEAVYQTRGEATF